MDLCTGSVSGREEIADMGAAAPIPPLGEYGPLRGRGRFVGGETGSDSRRAAGFAPDVPHFLGRARPLWRFGIEAFSIGIAMLTSSGKSCRENKISRDIFEEEPRLD